MPRVIGIDIPGKKRLVISLTYLYGIGRHTAEQICRELGFDESVRAETLSQEDVARINAHLQENYVVEGDLRRQVQNDIKRLISINCYRGQRHRVGLPVRGQRTSTNARTRKGKKKTVANKKKAV